MSKAAKEQQVWVDFYQFLATRRPALDGMVPALLLCVPFEETPGLRSGVRALWTPGYVTDMKNRKTLLDQVLKAYKAGDVISLADNSPTEEE